MSNLNLKFNPDTMTVSEVKEAVQILRSLLQRREDLESRNVPVADMFLASFDTMTQNVTAK